MPVQLQLDDTTHTIELTLTGTLTSDDYHAFVPSTEAFIQKHGKANMVFVMHDFTGWTPGASWEDLKFDMHHYADFERLAMVGEKKWEKLMTPLIKPFTKATVRYFDMDQIDQARHWAKDQP